MPAQMSQTPGSPGSPGSSLPGLNLSLSVLDRVPLKEALIAVATLTNGADWPVNTSGRLNLAEGDLDVVVTGPDGSRTRAGWPWPRTAQRGRWNSDRDRRSWEASCCSAPRANTT